MITNKLYLIKVFLLCLLLEIGNYTHGQESDSLLTTLRSELKYNMAELSKQEKAPYFMSLRLTDTENIVVKSNLGIATTNRNHERMVTPQIRLGNTELDNFKYDSQGSGATGQESRNGKGVLIPISGQVIPAMRQGIWQEVLRRYNVALEHLEQAKSKTLTGQDNEDKAPCFSSVPVTRHYEAPYTEGEKLVDVSYWENRLNKVTQVFKEYADIENGVASLDAEFVRKYLVTTEGTEVVQNRKVYRIMLSASVMAPDGMVCPLNLDYLAYSIDQFPDEEKMLSDAHDILERLKALRKAPIADPYTGPAILSGPASGVFFHEIFGHRLEGHRLKSGGQTFKKMIGQKILPETFNVYCDPTLQYYHGNALNGYYQYDDEGVKAQRVDNVEGGILKNFLLSRVPLEQFPTSNGHGRAVGGNDPVSRQSNLIVETTQPYSEAELKKKLIEEAKKQHKIYGYYFKTVTSGFTYTGEGGSLNSFNVTPIEVYRIYVDGRKDELVRGVDLIGTPLSMFSNIMAAGNTYSTFTGVCGAESGWVPVSASSPMIFVNKIETQRRQKDNQQSRILSAPTIQSTNANDDEAVFSAMSDEMKRTSQQLSYSNYPHAFYVDYNISHSKQVNITASLGGIIHAQEYPAMTMGSASLKIGNYQFTSDMNPGQMASVMFDGKLNYDNIRRELWKASDYMYKYCLNAYSYKQNYLANTPKPMEELHVPDFLGMKANEKLDRQTRDSIRFSYLSNLAKSLSAIFLKYPCIYNSKVFFNCKNNDIYRLNSEGVKQKTCNGYAEIYVSANIQTNSGSTIGDCYNKIFCTDKELDEDQLRRDITQFAERMMQRKNAISISDYYIGPIMFEDDAVTTAISNCIYPIIISKRSVKDNSGIGSLIWGKRIIDKNLSLTQLGNLSHYNNQQLLGYYQHDADGLVPQKELDVIKNGILGHLICGRFPALNCLESTANNRFDVDPTQQMSCGTMPGVMRLSCTSSVTFDKMKQLLCKEAKGQGLTYAYLIKQPAGCSPCLYRIDAKTGKEEMVNVYDIPQLQRSDFMHILKCATENNVQNIINNNIGTSIIAPRCLIVESMEKFFQKAKVGKAFPVKNPLVFK